MDIALNKLRPSLIAVAIESLRDTGLSLYIHGAPGISKSAVLSQVATRRGEAFIDFRASQLAPEDLRGVPMLGEVHGVKGVLWSPPLVFPRDLDYQQTELVDGGKTIHFFNPVGNNGVHYCTDPAITAVAVDPALTVEITDRQFDRFTVVARNMSGQLVTTTVTWSVTGKARAILAFEELNSAAPSVMAACYQLFFDRRLGDYIVPAGVMLVATGNRDSDKGVTYKLPKPLSNRFIHLEMIVNFDDWSNWGINHGIHSDVLGFLSRFPSKLMDFQPDSPLYSFATPRSWEAVSKVISQPQSSREVQHALVNGAIGTAIGTEFLLHRSFMAEMPDARGILNGKVTSFKPNAEHATQIAYSTAVQLIYLLKESNDAIRQKFSDKTADDRSSERKGWREQADRAIGYMSEHFPPEVIVVGLRMAMVNHGLRFSSDMPNYAAFAKNNKDLFFG